MPPQPTTYNLPPRRGFTLPELLVTVSIIGILASIGTVSYQSARESARDVKRASDMKQIQTAIELFFENHGYYPPDPRPGSEGVILGLPETRVLSDAGFGPEQTGTLYMYVPKNPEPGGTPYVYRSINADGRDCNAGRCESYGILFTLEKSQGNLLAGPHALTPQGIVGAEGGYGGEGVAVAGGGIVGIEATQATLQRFADQASVGVARFVDDPTVERVTEAAVAPVAVAAAAANTAVAAHAGSTFFQYLISFLTQPALFFSRKKRKAWGVVYNALSKLPEDLVIVRLRDAASGRVLKSTVTDAHGRFSFIAPKGRYRIEVAKAKVEFPSKLLAGLKEDGQYLDLYHGEEIAVGQAGAVLTPNIPVDPAVEAVPDSALVRRDSIRRFQRAFALVGPGLGAVSFAVKPSLTVGLLLAAQVVVYLLFKRLAATPQPKSWGIIYEEGSAKPVTHAVVRIFAMPYHKLLESQVTDGHGRYGFKVGNNVYYLTVTKNGFLKTETDPLDLSTITEPTVIASDIPLRSAPPPEAPKEKPHDPKASDSG
jgi:prepilin-type N-terminal cleavage/methylation domain-containing protein